VNPYSLSIVSVLILIFSISYTISWIIDKKEKLKSFMKSPNFDIVQFYIIKFTKEGLNNDFTFLTLYKNLLKVIIFIEKLLILFT